MEARLQQELESIRLRGLKVEATEADGLIYIVIENYPLPVGYNKVTVRLLLKLPLSYPNGSPDMFWVESDLHLTSGQAQASTNVESVIGQSWLRYSWHLKKWNPGTDNLDTYLEFVNARLSQRM